MSALSTAPAKACKPAASARQLPFNDHYLKSGLFRVCVASLVAAAPLVTLANRIVHEGEAILPGFKLMQITSDKSVAIDTSGVPYKRGF